MDEDTDMEELWKKLREHDGNKKVGGNTSKSAQSNNANMVRINSRDQGAVHLNMTDSEQFPSANGPPTNGSFSANNAINSRGARN